MTDEQAEQILAGIAGVNARLDRLDERFADVDERDGQAAAKLAGLTARLDRVDPAGAGELTEQSYAEKRAAWERAHPELAGLPSPGPGGLADTARPSLEMSPGEVAASLGFGPETLAELMSGPRADPSRIATLLAAMTRQSQVTLTTTHAPGLAAGDELSTARRLAIERGEFDVVPGRPVDMGRLSGTVAGGDDA